MESAKIGETKRKQEYTKQQEEEWLVFQSFSKDHPLPNGLVERSDKPDVLIHGERTLGIEITTLHIQDGQIAGCEQNQVKPRQRAVELAQEIHIKAGGRPIELAIGFDSEYPITDAKVTAHAIAEVAAHVQLGAAGLIDQLTYEHICCVNFMYLSGEYANPKWKVQQSYLVPTLQVDRVREVVAEKIYKAKQYQPCDAMWLLITVDFWNPAQDQDIEWPTDERIDCGPFERVFLYKPAFRRVVEVPRA